MSTSRKVTTSSWIVLRAGGNFGEAELTEERQQMEAKADAMPFGPTRATLALGDDFVFFEKLLRRLLERLFGSEEAGAGLPAQLKIPILRDLLRVFEALFFGAFAEVAVLVMRGTLPKPAVVTLINVDLTAQDGVSEHGDLA